MSKVDEAVIEIRQALTAMAPKHEGLRDFSRLNLDAETKDAVNAAIAMYDRRTDLLNQSLASLTALQGDGYPGLTIPNVSLTALQDLQANAATIAAALAEFNAPVASSLGLGALAAEPK